MADVPHVTAWAGRTKYQADGFLFDWVYNNHFASDMSSPTYQAWPGVSMPRVPSKVVHPLICFFCVRLLLVTFCTDNTNCTAAVRQSWRCSQGRERSQEFDPWFSAETWHDVNDSIASWVSPARTKFPRLLNALGFSQPIVVDNSFMCWRHFRLTFGCQNAHCSLSEFSVAKYRYGTVFSVCSIYISTVYSPPSSCNPKIHLSDTDFNSCATLSRHQHQPVNDV